MGWWLYVSTCEDSLTSQQAKFDCPFLSAFFALLRWISPSFEVANWMPTMARKKSFGAYDEGRKEINMKYTRKDIIPEKKTRCSQKLMQETEAAVFPFAALSLYPPHLLPAVNINSTVWVTAAITSDSASNNTNLCEDFHRSKQVGIYNKKVNQICSATTFDEGKFRRKRQF